MRFFIHPINPHISAEHADTHFEGWHYGIWEHGRPAISPVNYRFQAQHLEAAEDTRRKAEAASRNLPDVDTELNYSFPKNVHPMSATAARILAAAVSGESVPG